MESLFNSKFIQPFERKGINSLNSQIVGGIDRHIYDILVSAPGSFHDAAVYQLTPVKAWLETRFLRRYTAIYVLYGYR